MRTRSLLTTVSFIALKRTTLFALATAAIVTTLLPSEAKAKGCGGYVNYLQWGCAPWDDNPPKAGVTPGYPAATPKTSPAAPVASVPISPAASVISNDGGSVISHDGASVVSHDGGSLINTHGGKFISDGGSTLIGDSGSTLKAAPLVGNSGGTVISHDGASVISHDSGGIMTNNAGTLLSTSSGTLISQDGGGLVVKGLSAYKDTGPTPAQLALTEAQTASQALTKAGDLLKSDAVLLSNAMKANDQSLVGQLQAKLKTDSDALAPAGAKLAEKVALVSPADVTAVSALVNKSIENVKGDLDTVKATVTAAVKASADAATAPTAQDKAATAAASAAAAAAIAKAQDTATKAQAAATAADQAYKDVSKGVIRPADFATRVAVDIQGAATAVADAKAKSAASQALLTAANKGDPQGTAAAALGKAGQKLTQNDLVILRDKAVTDSKASFFQQDMAAGGYAEKYARANFADADLASAKSAKDTLTNLASKTTDAAQLATLNTAIVTATVVQQAAQAKSDQLNADASIVRLQASIRDGNQTDAQKQQNQAEVTRLQGVSTASQATIATIVKNNPTVAPVTAVAANNVGGGTVVPISDALKSTVVVPAVQQLSQQATIAVQAANAAVQQANTANQGGSFKQASTIAINSNFDVTPTLTVLTKAAASLNDKRVASLAPTAGGSTATPTASSPAQPVAIAPTATSPAVPTPAATALSTNPGVGKPADLVNNFTNAANAIGFAQQFKKPDGSPDQAAAAEYVGKLATKLSPEAMSQWVNAANGKGAPSQLAIAEMTQARDASQVEMARERAAVATPSSASTSAAKPVVVATAPNAPAPSVSNTSAAVSKPTEAQTPTKITTEQSRAVQQALRTIPGNLTKAEEKSFNALSAMVDRAATKGLSPEEATFLKDGLKALAEKHPNAEKQHGLTSLANTVAPAPKSTVAITTPAATPAAVASPSGNAAAPTAPKPAVASTTPAVAPAIAAKPAEAKSGNAAAPIAPKPTVASTTPAVAPAIAAKPAETKSGNAAAPIAPKPTVASTTPAVAPAITAKPTESKSGNAAAPAAPKPTVASRTPATAVQPTPAKPSPSQVTRSEPKPQPSVPKAPQVTAPKPALAASSTAPAKPTAAPAAKPQICTPNMQNGKQVGMICH